MGGNRIFLEISGIYVKNPANWPEERHEPEGSCRPSRPCCRPWSLRGPHAAPLADTTVPSAGTGLPLNLGSELRFPFKSGRDLESQMSTPHGILTVNQTWPFWRGGAEGAPGAATGGPRTAEAAAPGRPAELGRSGWPLASGCHSSLFVLAHLTVKGGWP